MNPEGEERRSAVGRREYDDDHARELAFTTRLDRVRRLLHVTLGLCVALFVLLAVATTVTLAILESDRADRRRELTEAVARSNGLTACALKDFATRARQRGDEAAAGRLEEQARRFTAGQRKPVRCTPPPPPPRIP